MEIHGTLKDAVIVDMGHRKVARGRIFGDTKGRFADGEMVRTSYIVSGPDADGVIVTRNSTYKLELAS